MAASTQNQAFNALLFLYREVLKMEHVFDDVSALRAKKPQRLPTVLSFDEIMDVIDAMTGVLSLAGEVLYGCGLRGIECVRLRVKDVDFKMAQVVVRKKDQKIVLAQGRGDAERKMIKKILYELKKRLVNRFHSYHTI